MQVKNQGRRHIYRSGDSEYKIDGKKVRLRDIHDLFLDTGFGTRFLLHHFPRQG